MPLDPVTVLNHLRTNRFDALLNEFENDWLECKGQPYDLAREDQELELTKDVSSLANANGGLLILGYAIYAWFGFEATQIPYTKMSIENVREGDPEEIILLG